MGCLNINIKDLTSRMVSGITKIGGISANAYRANKPIDIDVSNAIPCIGITCSIVCSINEE